MLRRPSRTGVNQLPNVIASGDAAANSYTVGDAMLDEGLASLAAFAKGERLPRLVDLDAGVLRRRDGNREPRGPRKNPSEDRAVYTRRVVSVSDSIEVIGGPPRVPLARLRAGIAAYLRGSRVERALLFGSYARGDADIASDLDLILIEESSLPFLERGRAHRPLFRLGVGVDLLVYTPEEYERLRTEGNPLIERAEREGVTIYARNEG